MVGLPRYFFRFLSSFREWVKNQAHLLHMVWYDTVWYGTYGIVWYGMVYSGAVWYGTALNVLGTNYLGLVWDNVCSVF